MRTLSILSQVDSVHPSYSLGQILIAIVVLAACCALVYVALRQFGIAIPSWVMQVIWIVAVCFVVIFAIKLVLSM